MALLGVMVLQNVRDEGKQAQKIAEVEKRFEQNPKETGAAWELARVKLESYVNRNLAQVMHIFWLTAFVMLCGFGLIGVGTYKAFADPDHFKSSVLSASSGVIVSFLGGTFLVLYRSTMAQAKEYVTMLERINAVGMSVQILDTLDDGNKELKHKIRARCQPLAIIGNCPPRRRRVVEERVIVHGQPLVVRRDSRPESDPFRRGDRRDAIGEHNN